jgi:hypothetical protein
MVPPIVPVSSVTVLAFTAFLVETERNLKTAFWLSLTLAGSYSFCSAAPLPTSNYGLGGYPWRPFARTIA